MGDFDPDMVERMAPWVDRACRVWYRLDVQGMEHVPDGAALIVGNHNAGSSFVEAMGVEAP